MIELVYQNRTQIGEIDILVVQAHNRYRDHERAYVHETREMLVSLLQTLYWLYYAFQTAQICDNRVAGQECIRQAFNCFLQDDISNCRYHVNQAEQWYLAIEDKK